MGQQVQTTKQRRSSRRTTERRDHQTPATDRREIRKDVAKVWFPDE
jgi:hypothetical protein